METIRLAIDGGVATLTLNAPERMNALSTAMGGEIAQALRQVRADQNVRAMILAGAGTHFCSGGDISAMQQEITAPQGRRQLRQAHGWLEDLIQLDVPVIAAVDGVAYGAGFSLALTADIILATPRARFGLPFLRMGVMPDCGILYTLPRIVGLQRAKALLLSMRELNAEAALDLGIVMEIVSQARLAERAQALALAFTEASPVAVGLTKQALNASLNQDLHTMLAMEADGQGIAFSTSYRREAADRFMAKQPLRFRWPD